MGFAAHVIKCRQVLRLSLPVVGESLLLATVAGDDDVTVTQPNAGIRPCSEVGVTAITAVADELPGQGQAVALGDPAGAADVPTGAFSLASGRRFPGQFVQTLDAFGRDAHSSDRFESEMSVASEDADFYSAATYQPV